MANNRDNAPIIIKRKKNIVGGGHHGGAWKVAYADFVTAMMAFFLLMWLLNATTEDQRKGIADYFNPSIPISRISGGGDGVFKGETLFAENTLAQNGTGGEADGDEPTENDEIGAPEDLPPIPADPRVEDDALRDLERELEGRSGESDIGDESLRHIRTRLTDEGLVIELFDDAGDALFDSGSTTPSPRMKALIGLVAEVSAMVSNDIAIEGHTDSQPYLTGTYGNWELSADRANASRRLLIDAGFDPARVARVAGHADRKPMTDDPLDPRNRRITVTLLRSDIGG